MELEEQEHLTLHLKVMMEIQQLHFVKQRQVEVVEVVILMEVVQVVLEVVLEVIIVALEEQVFVVKVIQVEIKHHLHFLVMVEAAVVEQELQVEQVALVMSVETVVLEHQVH